jgi:tetratricopeptide (TPR) repeat protein
MPVLLALSLAAAPVSPAPQPTLTLQQQFDAASDALAAGECNKAIPLFEALQRNPGVKSGSIPAAAIAVRKGTCLIRLGRLDEGESSVSAGLARLEKAGEQYALDVSFAYQALGKASLARADYPEARKRLETALTLQKGGDRVLTLSWLARATAFDPGPEPLAYSEEAIRLASAEAKPSKDMLAQLWDLHARVLMNRGESAKAYAELKKALQLSGGLTTKTSVAEASLRGDLALAALLLGKDDDARLYLAYTGAGRISESPFATGANMDPPECGEETGLKPGDSAVVEFGIAENGEVAYAETVQTAGGPKVAAAFARAVKDWYWRSDLLAKIPLFYRAATRLELRCSTAGGSMPAVTTPLNERFVAWAAPQIAMDVDKAGLPAAVASMKAILADREQKGDVAGQVAAAGLLALYDPVTDATMLANLDRAIAVGEKGAVPVEALNFLRVERLIMSRAPQGNGRHEIFRSVPAAEYVALAESPPIAADPIAADVLLVRAASPPDRRPQAAAGDWLRRVAEDTRLPEHHALRQVARLKLANRAAAAGDLAAAQGYFSATGLTERQCALIGATPSRTSSGVSSGDFPMEAMRYGFEGWVRLEFDISPDGKPSGVRPIAAYPPFVFVDAAQGMSRDFRYESSYRPSGGAACAGNHETVRFILPGGA